jgi:SAM-dependent methyltransferase
MAEADREKWNERHRDGYAAHGQPSAVLKQWIDRIPRGRALDLACGSGRNALFLAANGFEVDAVDISDAALDIGRRRARQAGLRVNWIEQDLDEPLAELPDGPLAESLYGANGYTLLLVIRFVDLPLIRQLTDKLAPGGMLVSEQHIVTDAAVGGPSDSAFRLQPGALREVAEGLRVLSYEEGIVEDPGQQPMALARLVAQKS